MLNKKHSDPALAEELPYWEFFSQPIDHLVLSDGSLVSALKIDLLDIECLDELSVNQLTQQMRGMIDSVSEGITLQFYFKVDSNYQELAKKHVGSMKSELHPLVKTMSEYRFSKIEDEILEGRLFRPQLILSLKTSGMMTSSGKLFKKKSFFENKSLEEYEDEIDQLVQNMESLKSSLSMMNLHAQVLGKDDLIREVYSFFNPSRANSEVPPEIVRPKQAFSDEKLLDECSWLAEISPRSQLVFGDLILNVDHFTLDSFHHRVITLKTLPELTFAGQFSSFLRMPFHYDLFLSIEIPPQAKEMSKLQQSRKMAHALAVTYDNKASDLESETKLNSTEELILELLGTGQRIYAVQLSLVLKSPSTPLGLKELRRNTRDVLARIRALQGAEGLEETVGSWKIVKENLPFAPVKLERAKKMKTSNLADFIPLYGPRSGDNDPVVMFKNRLGGLVSYNSFAPHLTNYNALVTGSSGAGKSFLNNCILLQEMTRNFRAFIIDIGGSYRKLTHALDGQYFEMNLSDEYAINPFAIDDLKVGPSGHKIKSLISIVETMLGDGDDPDSVKLGKFEKVLLEQVILDLYKEAAESEQMPRLSDFAKKLANHSEKELHRLSKLISIWTGDSPYGKLLDRQGTLSSSASICTFDLKGLSQYPDLQSVMILIITDFILREVERDKENKKRIILDEAWALLKTPSAAHFMEYCARTLRKTGSGITFITQGLDEIVATPIASAILNNTATKFVLMQRGDSQTLVENLKLNTHEVDLINSLEQRKGEYSEAFLIEGDERQVVRINPTPYDYWCSTSDAADNKLIEILMEKKGKTLTEAILEAARDYPQGGFRHEL